MIELFKYLSAIPW